MCSTRSQSSHASSPLPPPSHHHGCSSSSSRSQAGQLEVPQPRATRSPPDQLPPLTPAPHPTHIHRHTHLPGVGGRHGGEALREVGRLAQLGGPKVHVVDREHLEEAGGAAGGGAGGGTSTLRTPPPRTATAAPAHTHPRPHPPHTHAPRWASTGRSCGSRSSRPWPRRRCSSRGSAGCRAGAPSAARTRGRPAAAGGQTGRQAAPGHLQQLRNPAAAWAAILLQPTSTATTTSAPRTREKRSKRAPSLLPWYTTPQNMPLRGSMKKQRSLHVVWCRGAGVVGRADISSVRVHV